MSSDDDTADRLIQCQPVTDKLGVKLVDNGSFSFEVIDFIIIVNEVAETGMDLSEIQPASYVPFGMGIEPRTDLFDFLDRYEAKSRYGTARWDIHNLTHAVEPDDENAAELIVITSFELIVTIGETDIVHSGCGADIDVLPLGLQLQIEDGRKRALIEHRRELEP